MLIAPELKNVMSLINRLEQLESSDFKLFVRLLSDRFGFLIGPVAKKQHVKIYIEPNHHLLVVFMDQHEKYDTEMLIEDDADLDKWAKQIKEYLVRPHDMF